MDIERTELSAEVRAKIMASARRAADLEVDWVVVDTRSNNVPEVGAGDGRGRFVLRARKKDSPVDEL